MFMLRYSFPGGCALVAVALFAPNLVLAAEYATTTMLRLATSSDVIVTTTLGFLSIVVAIGAALLTLLFLGVRL